MGIGLVDDGTYSSIAITRSGALSLFAKNQSTAWTRILTATQIAGQYVPLTRTVNGKSLSGNIVLNSTDTGSLAIVNNLSDVPNKTTARTNLEVYSSGEVDAKLSTINQSITTTNSNVSDIQNDITIINANVNDQGAEIDSVRTDLDSFKTSTSNAIGTLGSDITEVKNDYVPKTTTVNGQPLSNNVTITAEDIDALTLTGNDLVLPGDITSPEFDGSLKEYIDNATPTIDAYTKAESDNKFVTQVTTVNGHALSGNVTVTKGDVGLGNVTNDAQLKVANNLSDVPNKAASRTNLEIDRLDQQYSTETRIYSDVNKNNRLTIQDGGTWGLYSDAVNKWIPLNVEQGGTGARNAAEARTNFQIDRFSQHGQDQTNIWADDARSHRLALANSGAWGFYRETDGQWMPLGVQMGGTGVSTLTDLRNNMGVSALTSLQDYTILTGPVDRESDRGSRMVLYANGVIGFQTYQGINTTLPISAIPIGGVVSMGIDGRPNGSILEHGSNSNGRYTKYADGTMVCWFTHNQLVSTGTASGNIFTSAIVTLIFPAQFVTVPSVTCSAVWGGSSGSSTWCNIGSVSNSLVQFQLNSAQANGNGYPSYMAIGRWV